MRIYILICAKSKLRVRDFKNVDLRSEYENVIIAFVLI